MTRVEVSSTVLRWALDRSGKGAAVAQKFPQLRDWVEGRSQPTLRQLENLARATHAPLGYFFLAKPPDERLPIPHFRTRGDRHANRPSPDLLETVQTMERRQAWAREYLIDEGQETLPFIRSAKANDKPLAVAEEMRRVLGLKQGWAAEQDTWTRALRELQKRMETASILVVVNGIVGNNTHRKLDPEEFRGFVLVDEYAPLVFVNGADSKAAQMFTLAWAQAQPLYSAGAKAQFADSKNADAWLVAYAHAKGCVVVTLEQLAPNAQRKIPIPNVCQAFGVSFVDTYAMLRALGVRLG